MNDHTLFYSDLVTLVLYACGLGLLSLGNRRFPALRWFFWTELLLVVKTALQGSAARLPRVVSYFGANSLVIAAFACMYLGFAVSVGREPRRRWAVPAMAAAGVAAYALAFHRHGHFAFVVSMLPVLVFCGLSAVLLLRDKTPEYRAAARVSAALLGLHASVLVVRAVVVTRYAGVPRAAAIYQHWFAATWLVMMFLDAALVGCFVWFFVAGLHRELHRLAVTDPLTGAQNRRALEAEAEREIARAHRSGTELSVLVLDIDRFKQLNDTRGHDAGDAVLCALVELLRHESRTADLVARTGGEEFILLLPDTTLNGAVDVAERLRQAVEESCLEFEGKPVRYTISIGVASLGVEQPTWGSMLRAADKALYEAKASGRNRVMTLSGDPYRGTLPSRI